MLKINFPESHPLYLNYIKHREKLKEVEIQQSYLPNEGKITVISEIKERARLILENFDNYTEKESWKHIDER